MSSSSSTKGGSGKGVKRSREDRDGDGPVMIRGRTFVVPSASEPFELPMVEGSFSNVTWPNMQLDKETGFCRALPAGSNNPLAFPLKAEVITEEAYRALKEDLQCRCAQGRDGRIWLAHHGKDYRGFQCLASAVYYSDAFLANQVVRVPPGGPPVNCELVVFDDAEVARFLEMLPEYLRDVYRETRCFLCSTHKVLKPQAYVLPSDALETELMREEQRKLEEELSREEEDVERADDPDWDEGSVSVAAVGSIRRSGRSLKGEAARNQDLLAGRMHAEARELKLDVSEFLDKIGVNVVAAITGIGDDRRDELGELGKRLTNIEVLTAYLVRLVQLYLETKPDCPRMMPIPQLMWLLNPAGVSGVSPVEDPVGDVDPSPKPVAVPAVPSVVVNLDEEVDYDSIGDDEGDDKDAAK